VIDALLGYGRSSDAPVLVVTHDHDLLPRFDRSVDVTALINSEVDQTDAVSGAEEPQITRMNADKGGKF
jgi:hypothetical protein